MLGPFGAALWAALFAACGEGGEPAIPSSGTDARPALADAVSPVSSDGGADAASDGGRDAGEPEGDAGGEAPDAAGPPPRDAGPLPPSDAGPPPPRDAGPPPPRDAQPPPPRDAAPPPPPPGPEPGGAPLPDVNPLGRVETVQGRYTDDFLYGPDELLKVATRRQWGATVVYFGMAAAGPGLNSANTVDSNDTGREVQIALYDPLRAMQGCAHDASCQRNPAAACPTSIRYLGWNPVQGGSRCNRGSGVEGVDNGPGRLRAWLRPLHWNPDWARPDCGGDACDDADLRDLRSEVRYTQRLRFVHPNIVEMEMRVENLTDEDHAVTGQEYPTLYATYGRNGTPDLHRILDSEGREIPIDMPANDGFFHRPFESPGGWAALQNAALDYGVGIYYENRLTGFTGWQRRDVFNNVRSQFSFGLPPRGNVSARAYLMVGSYQTLRDLAAWLDRSLAPFGWLDGPTEGDEVRGRVLVRGWALDNRGADAAEVTVDGQRVGEFPVNGARPDVCLVWPGYTRCPNVGFHGEVSLDGVAPGPHVLEVTGRDAEGNRRSLGQARVRVLAP